MKIPVVFGYSYELEDQVGYFENNKIVLSKDHRLLKMMVGGLHSGNLAIATASILSNEKPNEIEIVSINIIASGKQDD